MLHRTRARSRSWLLPLFAVAALLTQGCKRDGPGKEAGKAAARPPAPEAFVAVGDLAEIAERGALRFLVEGSEERFLPRQGMPAERDRALAEQFARGRGLEAEFILVESFDQLFPMLLQGKGDVIAADLAVTPARAEQVAFTWPLARVDEILIGKRGAQGLPRRPAQLRGRAVHVRESSSFAESLVRLREEDGIAAELVPAPEHLDPEQLAYEVSLGERPLTVVDSHLLAAIQSYDAQVEPLFPIARGRQLAWAVRKENPKLRAALDGFLMEQALNAADSERFTGDLDGIRARGILRVLTRNNPVTYFLHRGRQYGFDYELAKLAAGELGVRLEMVVPPEGDRLIDWLVKGRGDVIAASLTVTPEREAQVAFSHPYLLVDELLVQRKGAPRIETLAEVGSRPIHVRPSSSYHSTLVALKKTHPALRPIAAPEALETEELLDQVARGEIPLTVADSHLVEAERVYREDLEVALALTGPRAGLPVELGARHEGSRRIAFAVRKDAVELKAALDAFVRRSYRGLGYNIARRRYFEDPRRVSAARSERAQRTGVISEYDPIFRKYAARYGLDWRLIAAQAYTESRFDPKATSWVGAKGLMQVMPATGAELGFTALEDPDSGTHAGIKYLHRLLRNLDPTLPFTERIYFALAAYNAGIGHLIDARRIARRKGWDPDLWFGNVERAMLLLQRPEYYSKARYGYCRGSEPVKYVASIQARYRGYVGLFPQLAKDSAP